MRGIDGFGRSFWIALSGVFYSLAKPFVITGKLFVALSDGCDRRARLAARDHLSEA